MLETKTPMSAQRPYLPLYLHFETTGIITIKIKQDPIKALHIELSFCTTSLQKVGYIVNPTYTNGAAGTGLKTPIAIHIIGFFNCIFSNTTVSKTIKLTTPIPNAHSTRNLISSFFLILSTQ